ncbi:oligosaccharide flippase family protein [Enterococcus dongliensis]|uniref:lipopolysaccharide biosynthesis protein n=1 Tax=Enterococcus dongliensis TaxID=2559925 RepID=UPI002891B241|nr:polysaccharide biosynthesis C-terminal domain-containing protein [Enterococcus dongliensis]MDT2633452.1 oligosaccharide flippase family protein [Enterococcus dongliensis]MDT2641326.1 oligosaccharide flippase family protein [Enterococcus dongliensis]MDT2646546.1 oligosaccharide flippase family protein [Enterococcus dongliensis]MDT2710543.1 oligosaccharide flippase family protein [Enterococcus dongliensis]
MKDLIRFIKSTGIYLLGNVLSKSLSFFLLPLYTSYLSPNDYGTYDLSIAYNTFLISILFLDIWEGTMRFMFDFSGKDRNKPITIGILMFSISTGIYAIVLLIFGKIAGLQFLGLLFIMGLINNFQQVVGYIARGFGKNSAFVMCGLIGSLVTLLSNIILLSVFKMDYSALYISSILGLGINALGLTIVIRLWERVKVKFFDSTLFHEMLRYSLPLCLNSGAWWFLNGFNRVMISQTLSSADNGMYAVATRFSSMLMLITTGFQMAWQELSYSKVDASNEEKVKLYSRALNEYSKFLYLGLIALLPVIKIIFPYFIDEKYATALTIVPIALYGTFFSSLTSFLASIINILKKNQFIFITTLMSALTNVFVLIILIKPLGVQAATISLCAGYAVSFVARIKLVKKFVKLEINLKQFLIYTLLFTITVIIFNFGSLLINILELIGILVVFFMSYRTEIIKILSVKQKKTKND